eukprot:g6547.t1
MQELSQAFSICSGSSCRARGARAGAASFLTLLAVVSDYSLRAGPEKCGKAFSTYLRDLDDTLAEKKFAFDHSFWSHDQFVDEPATNITIPDPALGDKSRYASQEMLGRAAVWKAGKMRLRVSNKLGIQVLNNAWEGYHCCLFAYGQTGAGKSYSMVGYGANKGIVPLKNEKRRDIFPDTALEYDVVVSMLEIYNEKVQDLLIHPSKRTTGGLEIRVYVSGLTKCKVTSYAEIDQIMEQGIGNRTIGSTLMNATSSRAHTLSHVGDRVGTKLSCVYLVDLAGSEKAAKTGATGDRLKEGSAINKSLSCLGNVIEKLADACSGKANLKNVESLSTLRYADRAKKIKNQSVINEDPQDKIIRQLREENAKLREMVEAGGVAETKTIVERVVDEEALGKAKEKHEKEIRALEDALIQMQQDFFKKLAEAKQAKAAGDPAAAGDKGAGVVKD